MEAILAALAPIFILICIGYVLRRFRWLADEFWPHAERVTYYVFFPALLFTSLSTASFSEQPSLTMAGALITSVSAVSVITIFLRRFTDLSGPAFSSVFQGAVRMNTYVGIAGAVALAGDEGVTLIAIAILAIIPLVNMLSVPIVAHFGDKKASGVRTALVEIVRNPLILGCAAGYAVNVSGLALPGPIFDTARLLGRASLPLGLMAVGAGLHFGCLRTNTAGTLISSMLKLVVLPLLTAVACALYDVPPTATTVAIVFTALPTSASSYILARQLGGDCDLMAGVITIQTILAAVTMPLALYFLT